MKKTILIFAGIAALAGCAKEIAVENPSTGNSEFRLCLELETKTTNDGLHTNWAEGDQINLFHAEAGTTNYVNDGAFTVNPATGEATGTLASSLDASKSYDWYAIYPYKSDCGSPANYVYDLGFNTFHQPNNGGMSHLAGLPLGGNKKGVSASQGVSITMKNLLGVVKFEIYNHNDSDGDVTLKDIWFQVGADEAATQIQGIFGCNITGDEPVYTRENTNAIRPYLSFDSETTLARNQKYVAYLPVIPFSVSAGTLMRVFPETTTTDNISCQFTTPRAIDLKPGHILSFTANTRGKYIPWKKGLKVYMGDATGVDNGWNNAYRVEMPEDFQLSGSFDIKDLLSYVPAGVSFEYSVDNSPASSSALPNSSVLSSDGVWTVNSRLSSTCNVNNWGDKDGVFVIFKGFVGGTQYAFLRMKNPFADLTNTDNSGYKYLACPSLVFGSDTQQWALVGCPNYWSSAHTPGTTRDIVDDYMVITGETTTDNFRNAWYNLNLQNADGETILSADPTTHRVALSEMAAKYCKQSKGLYWDWTWYNRWINNAYTDGGMFDTAKASAATDGITLSDDGVITASNTYDSSKPYRLSFRQALQTDYDDLCFTYVGALWLLGCTAW